MATSEREGPINGDLVLADKSGGIVIPNIRFSCRGEKICFSVVRSPGEQELNALVLKFEFREHEGMKFVTKMVYICMVAGLTRRTDARVDQAARTFL